MKKFMVLSCMLVSMSMINAMEQHGNEGIHKGSKQEAPRLSRKDFMFPHMSPQASMERYLAFKNNYSSTNSANSISTTKGTTSPKPERNLP